uniref:Retrovirus-related Pol polyprotein from transposon TNT 1-94 n=1 Tax=Tanacetum cinerariifolium TaxID=118510 RepID=A0A6L2NXS2_TANCI|nr:retrovirus-related Pol polyprotein from transposon TNT 1-94 [Tanacetum cinerariifolium]
MTAKYEIKKFNGNNFSLWKLKMKAIIRNDKCLAIIGERPAGVTDDDCLVFDDVAASILEEENRRNNREDRQPSSRQVEALVATRGRSMEPGSSGSHNHGKYKTGKKKNNFKCFKCGKQGHFKKECRGSNTSNPQGNVASTSDDGNALCCEAAVANEGRKRFADVWLFDSGATFHIAARKEWFHQYKLIPEGGSVYNCNDHELKIIGIESIMVKMHDGTFRTIRDVRHVEGLKKNLLSLGQLDDLGEKVATNLYQLKGEIMKEAEALVASHSPSHKVAISWHQKLRHMSKQRMKILVDRKLLPGLTKQAPIQSLGGANYFVSFIDDYSKRCWVYPIKKKSDVFEVFKVYKARVELDFETKIKCLRTDNGGEYTCDEFDLFYRQEGIKRQFTTPYTPQQNRVAERMNRTLLERARAMLATASLGKSFWAEAVNTACYVINRSPSTALDPKSSKCLFLGYADGVKGYRLWDPTAHKVVVGKDVVFMEDKIQENEEGVSTTKETTTIQMEKEFQSNDSSEAVPQHEVNEMTESQAPTTRTLDRERRRPGWQADYVMESNVAYCLLTEDGEPLTLHEALNNPDALFWKEAMQEEIKALHKNKTWELVPLPGGRKPIGNKWVYKIKRNCDDQVERYRARLLDVKTAFLHGNLEEEIYMLQPEGFKQKGKENLVCRLNKSLYGLKQAPRCWYKRFDSFIRGLEYNKLHTDPCAYFKRFGNNDFIILLLYVNDMLAAGPNKDRINKLKAQLAREFEMKDLGPANKILGMKIHRDRVSRKIWLSQKSYVKKILQRFNMQDCKPISTPFPSNVMLSSKMSPSSEKEKMEMSRVPYASAVGSLMLVMICTRPDIAHAVGVVSRYMAKPGRGHWKAVKRILRYFKGTSDVALCFGDSDLIVTGYVDSDYAVVAMSTTKAEYVAAAQASKEAVWLKMLLEELGYKQEKTTLFCDNQSALYLTRNPTFHSKTKHIRVQYHFVREKLKEKTVDMQKTHTDDNVADYLTKGINGDKFKWCRSSCGLPKTFQSLLSQLEIHGAGVSTEDANQKFLRVFEYDVKGSTASSSSTQNVAFVSSDSTSSTNEVSTAYGVSTSSGHNSQREGSSSYTDEIMYSFFANQSSGPQLDHEDLEQLDELI